MKALVLKEYNSLAIEDVALPEIGPQDVLVRVEACGICGSDVHGMDGSSGRRRPPIIMGHEAAGTIAETGSEVSGWTVGDRVTFDSTIYCGTCDFCRSGAINLCDRRRVLGVSCEEYRQHGAFAEYVAIPERILYRVPPGLAVEHAALVEPFSIGLHAVSLAPRLQESIAVVIGAGMIGLTIVQALRDQRCARILAVDVCEDRLALAKECGATDLIQSGKQDALMAIQAVAGMRGADVSFEAVGIDPTVDLALRCLRKGGTAVLVGNVTAKVTLPLQVVVTRELSVRGSCASRGEYRACLELMARGGLDPSRLISAVAPLEKGPEFFTRLYQKEAGLVKVVLRPATKQDVGA